MMMITIHLPIGSDIKLMMPWYDAPVEMTDAAASVISV
jgi:hypothetical protein